MPEETLGKPRPISMVALTKGLPRLSERLPKCATSVVRAGDLMTHSRLTIYNPALRFTRLANLHLLIGAATLLAEKNYSVRFGSTADQNKAPEKVITLHNYY